MPTYKYDASVEQELRARLEARGLELMDAPHAYFQARAAGCVITFYRSGKLLIQGKNAAEWEYSLSPAEILGNVGEERFAGALAQLPDAEAPMWLGSDESGKGDYFGPLVTCAVRVERSQLDLLAELGAADSKTLKDKQIHEMAPGLKAAVDYAQVVLKPAKYNALYARIGNLNKLLAWTHARAIEDLLERDDRPTIAVIDKFGPVKRVQSALMERGQKLSIVQRTKAEDDPAVAVASILARNEYLWQLRSLSKEFGVKLAKGAGGPVLAAGRKFLSVHGAEALRNVAKLHFKTTQSIGA